MKRYAMLIVILVLSLKSFSQIGTQKNECYICLDSIQTANVIKDLITGDAAKEENMVLKVSIDNLKAQVGLLDLNVTDLEKQKDDLEVINSGQKELVGIYKADAEAAEHQLKKEKTKTTVYKVTTVLAVIGGFILAISN